MTKKQKVRASLTLETALVLPLFIYSFVALLYFIQIFILQEHIQETMTKTGLSMAKTAYVYADFMDMGEVESFDNSLFGEELDVTVGSLADSILSGTAVKLLMAEELDTDRINHSCIEGGFSGISFYYSKILAATDYIDLVARYRVKFAIPFFGLEDMRMIQRVRLRGWTGFQVPARYSMSEEDSDVTFVYITDTGTVYHMSETCSHIKLSVREVSGIPNALRNENGGKYYACEACCGGESGNTAIYYITSYGDRYHSNRNCPKIKRMVRKVPLSEVSDRTPCKRCGNR